MIINADDYIYKDGDADKDDGKDKDDDGDKDDGDGDNVSWPGKYWPANSADSGGAPWVQFERYWFTKDRSSSASPFSFDI